jgi:hypothetical protein
VESREAALRRAKQRGVTQRKRTVVLSSGGGRWNTGVWPNWGAGSQTVTLNWAAAGVKVVKSCPFACEFTHDEGRLASADAVIIETVNIPKFGLHGVPIPWPSPTRDNPRLELPQSGDEGEAAAADELPPKLPLAGVFYFEAATAYPQHTLANVEVRQRAQLTLAPSQASTHPITLICPWGKPLAAYVAPPPPKQAERAVAYFSEHGVASTYARTIDELLAAAGTQVHAYIHRANRPMPPEAGGNPFALSRRIAFMGTYRFVLVTEPVAEPDYVEWEWSQIFLAGAVPVYLGATNIPLYAPGPHSFVDGRNFGSGAELWQHLQRVAADDEAYAQYFAWKRGAAAAMAEDEPDQAMEPSDASAARGREDTNASPLGTGLGVHDSAAGLQPEAAAQLAQLDPATADAVTFDEASKTMWRSFRRHLDHCVHYAECRICSALHQLT